MSNVALTFYTGLKNPALFDPKFDGSQGTNRCHAPPKINGPDGKPAARDVDAVTAWLDLTTNPHTRRQKRKEIERFMLWCLFERGTHLSSIAVNDVIAYYNFLTDIPAEWLGPRVPRGPNWRPFEKRKPKNNALGPREIDGIGTVIHDYAKQSLSPASIRQTKVILADCFQWLTKVRYLDFNVFDKKIISAKQDRIKINVERHIPSDLLPWFCQWLDNLPADDKTAIRWRFTVAFLILTGLREAELASAKMGDVKCTKSKGQLRWFITVTGKGNKVRDVPIVRIETLMRYRESMDLYPTPLVGETTPLWIPLRGKGNVTPSAIYASIKDMVKMAAKDLYQLAIIEQEPQKRSVLLNYVDVLNKMSPHWLRHSFATTQVANGVQLQHIQLAMGHSSITTTENYVTIEKNAMYDAIALAERNNPPLPLV